MTIVLLSLGAVINIAVAWGMYLGRPGRGGRWPGLSPTQANRVWDRCWPVGSPAADRRALGFKVMTYPAGGTGYEFVFIWRGSSAAPQDAAWEIRAGWPVRSLAGHKWGFDQSLHGLFNLKDTWLQKQIKKSSPIIDDHLPYLPLWPGFAINTMLYALTLGLIFVAPFEVRRRWRIQGRQCPKCGYPVGRSSVCTECGGVVSPDAPR